MKRDSLAAILGAQFPSADARILAKALAMLDWQDCPEEAPAEPVSGVRLVGGDADLSWEDVA